MEHLQIGLGEQELVTRRKPLTASCKYFELFNEHNTNIKMDAMQLSIAEDIDKRPYAQRYLTALLFSPLSRLPSLQCFKAKVPRICRICCIAMVITKNANPVFDAAPI